MSNFSYVDTLIRLRESISARCSRLTMNWLRDLDIFIFSLTLLQFLGERIEYTSRKLIVFRVINCAVIVIVLIFIVSNVADPNPGEFVTSLENFTTVFHVISIDHRKERRFNSVSVVF